MLELSYVNLSFFSIKLYEKILKKHLKTQEK